MREFLTPLSDDLTELFNHGGRLLCASFRVACWAAAMVLLLAVAALAWLYEQADPELIARRLRDHLMPRADSGSAKLKRKPVPLQSAAQFDVRRVRAADVRHDVRHDVRQGV